ncbi:MAG: prolipoprotein diacylglyceryl transferase [Deltaproteobacteria bacterium]|nr:prolipoprotein diacylglyceryl transferase [Deltaproteobacteria bacterium]
MDPKFFHLGSLHLPAYFTMLSLGFVLAVFLARRWAERNGLDKGRMVDFGILMVVFGVVGAKILHIFADGHFWDYVNLCRDPSLVDWHVDIHECKLLNGAWDNATQLCHPVNKNCFAWLSGSGFAFYGGFIAAALFSIWFIRKHKWPAGKVADMGGWTIMLGLAWGRMGCFLAGCCFGAVTHSHSGISFPKASPASRHQWREGLIDSYRLDSLPVHPTQLYESILALCIAAAAYFIIRPRKRFDGQVFLFAMVCYAIGRFMLEFIRSDERGGLLGLSTSQLIAIAIVGCCAYLYRVFQKRAERITD